MIVGPRSHPSVDAASPIRFGVSTVPVPPAPPAETEVVPTLVVVLLTFVAAPPALLVVLLGVPVVTGPVEVMPPTPELPTAMGSTGSEQALSTDPETSASRAGRARRAAIAGERANGEASEASDMLLFAEAGFLHHSSTSRVIDQRPAAPDRSTHPEAPQ
jgi:hypothetical protein